jgi:hypothetical protein
VTTHPRPRLALLVVLAALAVACSSEQGGDPAGLVGLGPGPDPVADAPDLRVDGADADRGFAGHSVTFTGVGFGTTPGDVTWGDRGCVVTFWSPTSVTAYLPDDAGPATRDLVVRARERRSLPLRFTVLAPDLVPTTEMNAAWAFMRDRMRHPAGSLVAHGVFTSLKDKEQPGNLIYLEGHHVTSEHMGLMLWVAAAILDHKTFEESYRFIVERMVSPRFGVVHWGVDKKTGEPFEVASQPGEPLGHYNAPFDDLRIVNAAAAGYARWHDERYLSLALTVGRGLASSTISDATSIPRYPGGLVAGGLAFSEHDGESDIESSLVPINGGDLYSIRWLEAYDPRWTKVRQATVSLMHDARVSGQFQGAYLPEKNAMAGDWEYVESPMPDAVRGQKIKTIQSLWTAIHLARAGVTAPAAQALAYYKQIYADRGRIAEYMNPDGSEPSEPYFEATLMIGEARIYAQVARLAHYLGDYPFEATVIAEKILPDQDLTVGSPRHGYIGKASADDDDADSFNTLEALLALTLQKGSPSVSAVLPVP